MILADHWLLIHYLPLLAFRQVRRIVLPRENPRSTILLVDQQWDRIRGELLTMVCGKTVYRLGKM